MPLLDYSAISDYPFVPFTTIYSSDVNSMFSTIQTLLNTTKLDYLNVQALGLKRYGATGNLQAGTANYAIYNDASGYLAEAAQLPTKSGGLGSDLSPTSSLQAGQPIVVNSSGTGFTLGATSQSANNLYSYYNLK